MASHRVTELLPQLPDIAGPGGDEGLVSEPSLSVETSRLRHGATLPQRGADQVMAGGESLDVIATFLESLQLRGEPDGAVTRVADVERNYSKGIARHQIFVLGGVVEDEGEHSIDKDCLQEGWAVSLVEVEEDLAVAVRGEHHVGVLRLQLLPESPVVVDLPIDGERGVPGVVGDGLGPGQQAVDGEPLVSEVAALEAGDPIPVRAAVSEQFGEREQLGSEVSIGLL